MPCSTPCCSYESDFCAVVGERPGIPLKANCTKGCLSAFIWMRIQSTMHNCSKSPFSFNWSLSSVSNKSVSLPSPAAVWWLQPFEESFQAST